MDENIVYTQLFINYLAIKDPAKIKFFDKAGVKMPEIGTHLYGSSPVSEQCVQVVKKVESPNATLNWLISVNGADRWRYKLQCHFGISFGTHRKRQIM